MATQTNMIPMTMMAGTESVDRTVAILAHELREPLASIVLAVQLANEASHDERTNRTMWELVDRQARHATRIIQNVLDLSRAAHGKPIIHKEWCDAGTVIAAAVETVAPLIRKRQHRLDLSLPLAKVYLLADSSRLQQIVTNLLGNAAKYTEPGGIIRLSLEAKEDSAIIAIRDNGIGIAHDILPRVFEAFTQGDRGPHRALSGLGVGLAVVKSLVEAHGGEVTAHSDGEGTGAGFVVRLPNMARRADKGIGSSHYLDSQLVAA
jgi:signal transduction histidine kinase